MQIIRDAQIQRTNLFLFVKYSRYSEIQNNTNVKDGQQNYGINQK